jgi:protoporphyrinogen oxidase
VLRKGIWVSPSDGRRWVVVGGGFLGMTLAHRLAQAGRRVTLVEKADHLGGLASAWHLGDVVWDRHYHVTLLSDRYLRSLLGELGLNQEIKWVETRTGFYTEGNLYSMSNSLEFLRFPPLGIVGKLRLAATILYASRLKNWKKLERIPVATWLRTWSGKATFEKIWLPLLRAKLGENYTRTSAAFIWATIARMYAARRTGLKKEMFGYVPGGYARVLEVFHECLINEGVELKLGTLVTKVGPGAPGGVAIETAADTRIAADHAVVTLAAPVAARICSGLSDDELNSLKGIEYQGIVCASVLLKRPLAGFYVTNITDSWVPFTAVIEMSSLVDRAQFGGNTLLYLPKYAASDDSLFGVPDQDIEAQFLGALFRMYPSLTAGDVLCFRISRERFVHALSTLNYSEHRPPKQTSVPGIHLLSSAHIINGTLNVNETVKLAEDTLPDLLAADGGPLTLGQATGAA